MNDERFSDIPDYGELYTVAEFKEICDHHGFTNDDGSGYYSDGKVYHSSQWARPSDFYKGIINPKFTHVMWFNK